MDTWKRMLDWKVRPCTRNREKVENYATPRGENCFHSELWWRKVKHRPTQLSCGWWSGGSGTLTHVSVYSTQFYKQWSQYCGTSSKKLQMARKILHIQNLRKAKQIFWRSAFALTSSATYLARRTIGKKTVAYVTKISNFTAETSLGRTFLVVGLHQKTRWFVLC